MIPDATSAGTMYAYTHSLTFDHSSPTWEWLNNLSLIDSSDRGGVQFEGAGTAITVVQNAWTEIADGGTAIMYGGFTKLEKCRLNDEEVGELIWTGARERGRTLCAQAVITRTSGGSTNVFYEIALSINGIVQTDGKGSDPGASGH